MFLEVLYVTISAIVIFSLGFMFVSYDRKIAKKKQIEYFDSLLEVLLQVEEKRYSNNLSLISLYKFDNNE